MDDFSATRNLAALGVVLLGAVWFALRPPVLYLPVLLVLFVGAEWLNPWTTFTLFAVLPQVYARLPELRAFLVMTLFAATPWATWYAKTGDPRGMLPTTLSIVLFSQLFSWVLTVIAERNRAIAELSRNAGVAAERERLSAEIHDTLAQGFTSIVTLVQAARSDPEGGARHLDLALRTAKENLAEARALVAALAPAALDGSLAQALDRLVARLEEDGISGAFSVSGTKSLPTTVEVVLLRAAQEALTNVRKHSGAALVVVDLTVTDDRAVLTVHDDGAGFGENPEGFGLRGMRNRVEQVGGTVSATDSDGAVVVVEVPL
ncbi:sensor histidine kinase [Saccharothrix violaceirubra]|uniref:Signal transduction histidine kinase n=1 Tax=Saccharothrix violaceirubra TaxID=413306 RepID=A0A7W7T8V7_9PSEU|nr:histidine kinase [Saccharothrix violaceirubra]MBB4968713.1 signal transduction histidine kinase [Saccharothrix violaceirubra]